MRTCTQLSAKAASAKALMGAEGAAPKSTWLLVGGLSSSLWTSRELLESPNNMAASTPRVSDLRRGQGGSHSTFMIRVCRPTVTPSILYSLEGRY